MYGLPDTNILVSGLTFQGGRPFQFLKLARAGQINLTVSDAILAEMEDVLPRKFSFTTEEVAEARMRVMAMARPVKPTVTLDVIKEDPPTIASSNVRSPRGPIIS